MKFKQTGITRARLALAVRTFLSALRDDVANDLVRPLLPARPQLPRPATARNPETKPAIFISYATDDSLKGSHVYCGGEKLLNNLVLLLRRHGYEAFMVSLDGRHSGWLAEHAPFLSLEECRTMASRSSGVRFVTSWIMARAFLELCPRFYFWDQELGASSRSHFPQLEKFMARGRIIRTAGVNRVVQAWHRAVFGTPAGILRQLVDEKYWRPDEARRVRNRVGYFDEGEHGADYVRVISEATRRAGLELEFHLLQGPEAEIIKQMQTCSVFLALNIGKSPLWGEGGPMTPQEAMACGTVPVCFDLCGAWEFIQQDYNGVITREIRPELMAEALASIYSGPGRLELMSRRCLEITAASHTMEARWSDVVKFLDLPE